MDDEGRISAARAEVYELGYRLLVEDDGGRRAALAYARPVSSSAGGRLVARGTTAADAAEVGARTLRRVLVHGDPWPS